MVCGLDRRRIIVIEDETVCKQRPRSHRTERISKSISGGGRGQSPKEYRRATALCCAASAVGLHLEWTDDFS